ncbi:MAG: hypothetical protein ACXW27_01105 [Allosphingosinicella sp.]
MTEILKIAGSITNPISLVALLYLILFLLFRGVLSKVAVQKGAGGQAILMRFMTWTAVVALLTVVAVFGFKAFEVYSGTKVVANDVNRHTDEAVKASVAAIREAKLDVEFRVDTYTGASIDIANEGQGVILVDNLTLHWSYRSCPKLRPPSVGAPLVEFRYTAALTMDDGSKLLDRRTFKYGPGEIDRFLVDLEYPGNGVYSVWLSFDHRKVGETSKHFETEHATHELCIGGRPR